MLFPFTLTRVPSHYFTDVCGVMYPLRSAEGRRLHIEPMLARLLLLTRHATIGDGFVRDATSANSPDSKGRCRRHISSGSKKLRAIRRRGLPSSSSLSHPLQVRTANEGTALRQRRAAAVSAARQGQFKCTREGGREGGRLPLTFSRNDRKEGEGASE